MRPRPHSSTAKACRRRSGKGRETSASGARSAGTERQGMGWRCPHIGAAWMRPRSVRILSINENQPQGIASPGVDILAAVKAWSLTRLWPLAILPSAFLLGSCEGLGGISPIFPTPVSPNGQGIYNTYIGISIPAIIIFIGVEAALLWVVLRYRRSKQPVGYVPPQIHDHRTLEISWTIAPLIVVLAIAGYSFVELQKDFLPITNQQMTVVVSGHQFGWDYRYENGIVIHQEGTLAGDVTPFVVPTHTLVKLQFQGTDVIHSWWVPAISGKTDAVPGYDNYSWLKIDEPGKWRGECAELCGAGHGTMQIIVQAMDQHDYDIWVRVQQSCQHAAAPSGTSLG